MPRVEVKEVEQGGKVIVTAVYIDPNRYGSTGHHWARALGESAVARRYGKLFIDRPNAAQRRTEALEGSWKVGRGDPADLDECPGAMFRPSIHVPSDVELCDAGSNRALGTDLKNALAKYRDWTEVQFHFKKSTFDALSGTVTHRAP
jgi:hypothetical protein